MSEAKKRAAPRRPKSKTSKLGQKSILDHFSVKEAPNAQDEVGDAFDAPASQPQTTSDTKLFHDEEPEHNATDSVQQSLPTVNNIADVIEIGNPDAPSVATTQPRAEKVPPKKLFPLFDKAARLSRTLSAPNNTISRQDDLIIDISDDDSTPTASGSGSGSQPIKAKAKNRRVKTQTKSSPDDVFSFRKPTVPDRGTERKPIIIDASPVREPIRITPFPTRSTSQRAPPSPTRSRHSSIYASPFPTEQTQHTRGPQTDFSNARTPFGRRTIPENSTHSPTHVPSHSAHRTSLPSPTEVLVPDRSCDSRQDAPPFEDSMLDAVTSHHGEIHPAIHRFFDPEERINAQSRATEASQQNWSEKWRPRRADQVLGNERNACYLRDWLRALRLHFDAPVGGPPSDRKTLSDPALRRKRKAKRPQILREVQRPLKRRRGDLDGWIADDDDIIEEVSVGSDDDDFILGRHLKSWPHILHEDQESPGSPVPTQPFVFGDKIHNTILLSGPSGCGKTAAVYACANELGWEVFEVYPGIGRRGGTNLDTLIGDVGKNHLVQRPRMRSEDKRIPDTDAVPQPPSSGAFASFLQLPKLKEGNPAPRRLRRQGTQDEPLEVDEDNVTEKPGFHSQALSDIAASTAPISQAVTHDEQTTPQELQTDTTFRQSIILFEEVDILFREDAGFWPAVVKFIKDCKRPVVMTCNDPTLVPTEDLPLQDTLLFSAPPRPLAASFLHGLCAAEGIAFRREYCLDVITASGGMKTPPDHRGFAETGNPSERHVDLRQCINQCQFGRSAKVSQHLLYSAEVYEARDVPLDELFDGAQNGDMKPDMDSREQLRQLVQRERNADSVSLLDAFCTLSHPFVLGLSTSHGDDQNGYTGVEAVVRDELAVAPEYYAQDTSMVAAMRDIRLGSINGAATSTEWGDKSTRHEEGSYEAEIEYALAGNVPRVAFTLQRSTVFLEYSPWIRCIVRAQEEEAESETRGKGGRQTRNSQGSRQNRWLEIGKEQVEVLKRVALGGW